MLLSFLRFSKQKKKKIKMPDQASTSGYREPQCKKFLTTDEVLTELFDSDNNSDWFDIRFDSETISSDEFLDVAPTLVHETKLEEPGFWDTLLDIDVSCLFCLFDIFVRTVFKPSILKVDCKNVFHNMY